jgi:hypothetical protein
MTLSNRTVVSAAAGVIGLLAAGILTAPAAPAAGTARHTRAADVSVELAGGTIATGASLKYFRLNVSNNGPVDAHDFVVVLDLSGLDRTKLRLDLPGASGEDGPVCDEPRGTRVSCRSSTGVLPAGIQYSWSFPYDKVPGAKGYAGRIKATVTHDRADARPADNKADLTFRIAGHGADLWTVADDAESNFTMDDDGGVHWQGVLAPGGVSSALFMIVNHGDVATSAMRVTIRLPRGVTFANADGPRPVAGCWAPGNTCAVSHCDYRDHNRTAVCTWFGFTLIPFSQDTTADNTLSKQPFVHAIKVDPNLAAPARLLNGTVTVQALAHGRVTDVDTVDSTDGMRVIVAAP